MSNLIKVAVIGAGMMGKNHLRTYKSLPHHVRKAFNYFFICTTTHTQPFSRSQCDHHHDANNMQDCQVI